MNIRPGDILRAIVFGVMSIFIGLVLALAAYRDGYDKSLVCPSGEVLVKKYPDNGALCVAGTSPAQRP